MIIRLLPKPSIISFITTTNRSFLLLRSNLLPVQGKLKKNYGIHLNVRSMSASASSSSTSPVLSDKQVADNVLLLSGKEDEHGGVIVEMCKESLLDPIGFAALLKASMLHWKQQGKRGIWIKLPIELVNLIEPVVKEGFSYHHAEPNHLMLVRWIPETVNTLPANASHRVGIGAFVTNEKGEVLVVQEKSGKFQGTGVWKFPTGVVDEGEDICDAAVREVKEETGWMPFEEYAAQSFVQKHDLLKYMVKICMAKRDGKYNGFSAVPTVTSFSKKQSNLYFNTRDVSS